MLLARAIRRAGSADVAAVRRAAANHRYDSPQGPVWVDPDNNHCFLTPRLARSVPGCQFQIFWEADAPERPDPYLSNLDLAAIGTGLEKSNDAATKSKPSAYREMTRPSPFSVRGRRALMVMRDEREISIVRRQLSRLGMIDCGTRSGRSAAPPNEAVDVILWMRTAIPIKSDPAPAWKSQCTDHRADRNRDAQPA